MLLHVDPTPCKCVHVVPWIFCEILYQFPNSSTVITLQSEDATEEMKREQMERLVREELERWDSEAVISRPGSAISRPGTSRSRPGTGYR